MQIITRGIGQLVLDELRKAVDVHLAVAFFSPDDRLLEGLRTVSKLTVIVSEEFTINDPYKLEALDSAVIRSIPLDSEKGRLHAKVLIVKRRNGSRWALLGSANMTYQGLFVNQEACVALEDEEVGALIEWFGSLFRSSRIPDFEEAKRIFASRSLYRLERRTEQSKENDEAAGYWILKTTSGDDDMPHWPQFISESVVAIGWESLPLDPSAASDEDLLDALEKTFPGRKMQIALPKIRKFIDLKIGDIVLICRGYNSNHDKPVHIYGLARVTGPFYADPHDGRTWRFKHDAVIQVVDIDLARDDVAESLRKQSLIGTIHDLDKETFDRLTELLRRSGVQVAV